MNTKTDSLKNKSSFKNIINIKRDWNEYTTRDGNGLGLISKVKYIQNMIIFFQLIKLLDTGY